MVKAASSLQIAAGTIWRESYMRQDAVNTQIRSVDQVIVHPRYDTNSDYDVALLHVVTAFTYTDYVRPVCLPSPTADVTQYTTCFTTGFGLTSQSPRTVLSILLATSSQIRLINDDFAANKIAY